MQETSIHCNNLPHIFKLQITQNVVKLIYFVFIHHSLLILNAIKHILKKAWNKDNWLM